MKEKTSNKIIKDLRHRFDSMSSVLASSINSLDAASESFLDFKAMQPLINHYDMLNMNDVLLKADCQRTKLSVTTGEKVIPKLYLNLEKLFLVYKTLPVSTATVERGFSCMRRIISNLRNRLTTSRASDLMLASLNKDLLINVDIDKIIDRWDSQKSRHIQLN